MKGKAAKAKLLGAATERPSDLDFTLENAEAPGKTELYIGHPNGSLKLSFTANVYGGVSFAPDSCIQVFMPSALFTPAQVKAMALPGTGWTLSAEGQCLKLSPPGRVMLGQGEVLSFTLTGVFSGVPDPASGQVKAKFVGVEGVYPLQIYRQLALCAYPAPGLAELPASLSVSLDSKTVYCWDGQGEPLSNTLVLNLKNTSSTALVTAPWGAKPPVVMLSFVYGDDAGALTKDSPTGVDSARNISARIHESYKGNWRVTPPGPGEALVWKVSPLPDVNVGVLGARAAANVDIALEGVVTVLPPGHTQLYVQCANFPGYHDCLFVLDVKKALPEAGILGFAANPPFPKSGTVAQLLWATSRVSRLLLRYKEGQGEVVLSSQAGDPEATDRSRTIPLNLQRPGPWTIQPLVDTNYVLEAYGADGLRLPPPFGQKTQPVGVIAVPPVIRSLTVSPNPVKLHDKQSGVPVTVRWQVDGMKPGVRLELNNSTVSPDQPYSANIYDQDRTTYVLKAFDVDKTEADSRTAVLFSYFGYLRDRTFSATATRMVTTKIPWSELGPSELTTKYTEKQSIRFVGGEAFYAVDVTAQVLGGSGGMSGGGRFPWSRQPEEPPSQYFKADLSGAWGLEGETVIVTTWVVGTRIELLRLAFDGLGLTLQSGPSGVSDYRNRMLAERSALEP